MADRLNSTAGALLGLLRNGPRSGYDLVAEAEETIGGFWTITRSQVYRELAALTDRGLLEKGQPGPRDRQPFRLTAAGRAAFRSGSTPAPNRRTCGSRYCCGSPSPTRSTPGNCSPCCPTTMPFTSAGWTPTGPWTGSSPQRACPRNSG